MKIVVTGAGGQLGHAITAAYEGHDVVALTHRELDVSVERDVFAAMADAEPALVVHTAAWTDVDGCELDPDRAHQVNALGAWWVARACAEVGAAMIHLSTDYVFGSGGASAGRPYSEFDAVEPVNAYGWSKAAGEELVRSALDRHFIVRTSWLCGPSGSNFVTTMLRMGLEGGEVTVVDDQIGSPTFTPDLASAIHELSATNRYGTYHRTNTGHCSWFDLAGAVFATAGLDVQLSRGSSVDFGRAAVRPSWSVLSNAHAELSGLRTMRRWEDGVRETISEVETARLR